MNTLSKAALNAFNIHQSGDLEQAIIAYKNALNNNEDAKTLELLGIAYAQMHDYQTALIYFIKAEHSDKYSLSIQNNLATCYKKCNRQSDAIKTYQSILDNHPAQCITLNNLAALYIQSELNHEAIPLLLKALCIQKDYPDAYFNLGLAYIKTDKDPMPYFKKAEEGNHFGATYQMGQYLEAQGNYVEAKYYYLKCIEKSENHAASHHGLGRVLLALDDDMEALKHLIIAQKSDPAQPHLMENIAAYYHTKGMYANAIEYWSKAPKDDSNEIEIKYNIGVAYHYCGRHSDALIYLKEVIDQEPNHVPAHMNIAAIALQNGNKEHAVKHYNIAYNHKKTDELRFILDALNGSQDSFESAPKDYVENLFDQYARHYEQHLTQMLKYTLPSHIERCLHEHIPKGSKLNILDLGCGTGIIGKVSKHFAKSLIGVDLSNNMLDEARKKHIYDELIQGDCIDFLNDNNKYDCIIAAELLPYIGNAQGLLTLITKSLRPGGIFLISFETSKCNAFKLSDNARYSHNIDWIKNTIKLIPQMNTCLVDESHLSIRSQQNKPVAGCLLMYKMT